MHWCFIINSRAGGGKAEQKWRVMAHQLQEKGLQYEAHFTRYSKHATELARELAHKGERCFVAGGGDGSVNEVLQGLWLSGIPLSEFTLTVLPWGSGNDWARMHGIPSGVDAWLKMFFTSSLISHDVGLARYGEDFSQEQVFINIAGTGLDALILEKMGPAGGRSWRYYLTLLSCLLTYRADRFHISGRNINTDLRGLLVMACIGQYGGGGMRFAPDASVSDGCFDLVAVSDMPLHKRLVSLPALGNGKINAHPAVLADKTPALYIHSDHPWSFQCDGELVGQLPVQFSVIPHSLQVVAPGDTG